MTIGKGGLYDDINEFVFDQAEADFAATIILGGSRGSGFSVTTKDPTLVKGAAKALRAVADQLDADAKRLAN